MSDPAGEEHQTRLTMGNDSAQLYTTHLSVPRFGPGFEEDCENPSLGRVIQALRAASTSSTHLSLGLDAGSDRLVVVFQAEG